MSDAEFEAVTIVYGGKVYVRLGTELAWEPGPAPHQGIIRVDEGMLRVHGPEGFVQLAGGSQEPGGFVSAARTSVMKASGKVVAELSSEDEGVLRLGGGQAPPSAPNADAEAIKLEGSSATLTLGATGRRGLVSMRSDDDRETVRIDGSDGAMRLGAGGKHGAFLLRNAQSQQTVRINGGEGSRREGDGATLSMCDARGQETVRIDAAEGAMRLGSGGQDGLFLLRDASGRETVRIEAKEGGDIVLANADCAEEFDVADEGEAAPGNVMVLGDHGELREGSTPYDTRVAGVISGASTFRPALVLDRRAGDEHRAPLALVGKVYCKVDATYGAIGAGDLLTTSSTPGHAMKAADPLRAFGAVLGKALEPLASGRGLIPILVTLQ